jgi:hypothetical protein
MKLFERLDRAYAQSPTPDGVVRQINDPLAGFIKIEDLSEDLFQQIKNRRIAFYNWQSRRWDGAEDAEAAYNGSFSSWATVSEMNYLANRWAVIGFEHRLNPDLVFPS